MGVAAAWAIAALLVAGCGNGLLGGGDPYPMPAGRPHTAQGNRVVPGQIADGHLLWVTARPGDRIELLGAETIGAEPLGPMELLLSRVIAQDDGSWLWGDPDHLEPLAGAVLEGMPAPSGEVDAPESTVLIVGRVIPDRAGRMEVTDVRSRYRINGSDAREGTGISTVWAVCADDPAPVDCEAPPF